MKYRAYSLIVVFMLALLLVPFVSFVKADESISLSEKRPLVEYMDYESYRTSHPGAGLSEYFQFLEDYFLDQFPARDAFRKYLVLFRIGALAQFDHHGYYELDGHLGKLDPVLNEKALAHALSILEGVARENLGSEEKPLFALIPDKNVFLLKNSQYPSYAYDALLGQIDEALGEGMDVLSLLPHLSIDDYYRTDPHWDQKYLMDVANLLLEQFGFFETSAIQDFELQSFNDYWGTYAGQMAWPVAPDTLNWLSNDTIDKMVVWDLVTGETGPVYETDKLLSVDPYDLFLGGAKALLRIENTEQHNGRQLIVFRDSFGSSLIPLLAPYYEEVLVIDLRYIAMRSVLERVSFESDADVLFLFSSSVANSPGVFKK